MSLLKDSKTNRIHTIKTGNELLQAYRIDSSLPFKFGCCNGECGTCAFKVFEGDENLSKKTKQERKTLEVKGLESPPYRLACQCAILGDVVIE